MGEFFYALCIEPLRALMEFLLEAALALTGSPGWSVIALSLAVNVALWPIYALAEGWQEEERSLRRAFTPKLEEIKSVYRGRERWFFVRALYRLHGYHPGLSLRAGLGFFLQIPFFLAAWSLLSAAPELTGSSFAGIEDLGRPDALLSLGGFRLHILPLLMTGVNLLSAALYSSRLTRRDKIQLYALAALFLLLLYQAPAGLLLYWTCNNIFSLGKNLYYLRYVYRDGVAKTQAGRLTARKLLSGLRLPLCLECALALLAIALMQLDNYLFRLQHDHFFLILPAFLAALSAALSRVGNRGGGAWLCKDAPAAALSPPALYLNALCAGLLLFFLLGSLRYGRMGSPAFMLHSLLYMGGIALDAFWLLSLPPPARLWARTARTWAGRMGGAEARRAFLSALFFVAALIFIYHPAGLYASDPGFFADSPARLFGSLGFNAFVFLGLGLTAFSRCPEGQRPLLAAAAVWLALLTAFYSLAPLAEYGIMSGAALTQTTALHSPWNWPLDAAAGLGAACLTSFLGRKGRIRALPAAFLGPAVLIALLTVWNMPPAPEKITERNVSAEPPAYSERLFSFSRDANNIIIFMLDQFTGEHMERLRQDEPELLTPFSGFVWYKDTLSPGNHTHLSTSAIMGGPRYLPARVNARADLPLEQMRQEAYAALPKALLPQGYSIVYSDLDRVVPQELARRCPGPSSPLILQGPRTAYVNWRRSWAGLPPRSEPGPGRFLSVYGLFKSAPLSLRAAVYGKGRWFRSVPPVSSDTEGDYALLEALLSFSSFKEGGPPTFKYIGTDFTHDPWSIDAQCRLGDPSTPGATLDESGIIMEHLWAERCALRFIGRWLDKLRAAGALDNSMVILVSDHGYYDAPSLAAFADRSALGGRYSLRASSLLMFKDFGASGPLRVSEALMSPADVPALICSGLPAALCAELDLEPLPQEGGQGPPRRRYYSSGEPNEPPGLVFESRDYAVEGPMRLRESWREIKAAP